MKFLALICMVAVLALGGKEITFSYKSQTLKDISHLCIHSNDRHTIKLAFLCRLAKNGLAAKLHVYHIGYQQQTQIYTNSKTSCQWKDSLSSWCWHIVLNSAWFFKIPYRMKVYTEFNSTAWPIKVTLMELNIGEFWFWNFWHISYHWKNLLSNNNRISKLVKLLFTKYWNLNYNDNFLFVGYSTIFWESLLKNYDVA